MTTTPSCCPRCRSEHVSEAAQSPVAGCWVMYSCSTCWYAWRTSEPPSATDPDQYPADFRLVAEEIAAAARML